MAISCTANDLATSATCFNDVAWKTRQAIKILLLCSIVNGTVMDCSPNALATAAACFFSLSAGQMDAIEVYLLCQVASGGAAGAREVFSGNYGGVAPVTVPTATAAIAYDLDAPFNQWTWTGAAWA